MFTAMYDRAVNIYGNQVKDGVSSIPYRLPSGITMLDSAMYPDGKGYPGGRIIEIFGKPGVGKSWLGLAACRQAQLRGGMAVYLDSECALDDSYPKLAGINTSINWVYAQPETAEQCMKSVGEFLDIAYENDVTRPVVIVIDTIAALVPDVVKKTEYSDTPQIAALARLLSRFLPEGAQYLKNLNAYLICLNQTRANLKAVGFGVDPDASVGGQSLDFYTSIRIKLTRVETLKYGGGRFKGQEQGMEIEAQALKVKGGPSRRKAKFPIYTHNSEPIRGIDDAISCFDYLKKRGIIVSAGMRNYVAQYRMADVTFELDQFRQRFHTDAGFGSGIRTFVKDTFRDEYGENDRE